MEEPKRGSLSVFGNPQLHPLAIKTAIIKWSVPFPVAQNRSELENKNGKKKVMKWEKRVNKEKAGAEKEEWGDRRCTSDSVP